MIISFFNTEPERKVLISETLLQKIRSFVFAHFPNEFGGILTGIVDDKNHFIIDMEVPNTFLSSTYFFERNPESLNQYLSNIYEKSDGKIVYLGEWHSHPKGSTQFSNQDLKAMKNIACDPKAKNHYPLLLIIGGDKENTKIDFYITIDGYLKKLTKI